MEKLHVDLKNCYGINKLNFNFSFDQNKGCLIYASNGTMKTSFANTFLAVSENRDPEDRVHHKKPSCKIEKKENGSSTFVDIESDDIFVINSYNEELYNDFIKFDNISFLLVKEELKKEYDAIYKNIEVNKKNLLNKMKALSGLSINKIEDTFLNDYCPEGNFLELLSSLDHLVDGKIDIPISEIKYQTLFNDKAIKFLQKENIIDLIEKYANKYSELVDNSEIFVKDVFTHNNATSISKQLKDNGFFDAEHKISLKNISNLVESTEELEKIIQFEKEKILSEKELNEWFEEIDSELNKNKELRSLRKTIESHKWLISKLRDIPKLKKDVWLSILNSEIETYSKLINIYQNSKKRIEEIVDEAQTERSDWEIVIELFNKRFDVPFELEVSNQSDVILKNEVPVVKFKYKDPIGEDVYLENENLRRVLSNGEKRALYLLYVIYGIQIKIKNEQDTLIIADDIVDSFDYQNKYAIVEYLNDILEENIFKIIILTHNFDFYRTVGSRLTFEEIVL